MENTIFDVIIVGGGPAGYTAALYTARNGYRVAVIEMLAAGGQMATANLIENYPGFPEGIDGVELGLKMQAGAERFGAATIYDEVVEYKLKEEVKEVIGHKGRYRAKSVVLAIGAFPRKLGIEMENEMLGKGIAYCALCDGMRYKKKDVLVVGGGNSAITDAIYLTKICKSVTIVHRRNSLSASKKYLEDMKSLPIKILWNSKVTKLLYHENITGAVIEDINTGAMWEQKCDAIFIDIGRIPNTEFLKNQVELDEKGYISAQEDTKTNLPGVFAVGDARTKELRQIVTAVSDGAVAAYQIEKYLM